MKKLTPEERRRKEAEMYRKAEAFANLPRKEREAIRKRRRIERNERNLEEHYKSLDRLDESMDYIRSRDLDAGLGYGKRESAELDDGGLGLSEGKLEAFNRGYKNRNKRAFKRILKALGIKD